MYLLIVIFCFLWIFIIFVYPFMYPKNMNTTFKIMLHPLKTLKDNKKPIVLRLTNNRKRYYNYIGYYIPFPYDEFWDDLKGEFKKKYDKDNYSKLNNFLRNKLALASSIVLDMETKGLVFDYETFKKRFERENRETTIIEYFNERIKAEENKGKIGNSIIYKTARNTLTKFKGNENIYFSEITPKFLERLEEHLFIEGWKGNGISVCMRTIRALINQAIKENIYSKDSYPFKNTFTPNGYDISKLHTETAKRAISKAEIKMVALFKPKTNENLRLAQNVFLFSYYNMGINFTDIAFLKWDNIYNDRINYTRAKTRHKKKYSIAILPPVKRILEYYKQFENKEGYVFPILNETYKTPVQIKTRIQTKLKDVNADLRTIAEKIDLKTTLTTYVARHSWATILKRSGVSTSVISEGLGHRDEKTTQIYLDSFENEVLDKANSKLL